ncbi:uncharacterized protein LOC127242866 [Andrographis paniculata]|uniref:uncharacterized protein LOC127242866 n=1 Tax=Andrographis paniculata TaxID=175694 RepID=UPI0021E71B4A|nr:uncharacterized protein LOC127242866 [Andrographis paniculata]
MGNAGTASASRQCGEVILSDGNMLSYSKPLTVAELMLEHPQEVVVEFHPAMIIINNKNKNINYKATPLPADHTLDIHKLYLMLPKAKAKSTSLTSFQQEQARLILAKAAASAATSSLSVLINLNPKPLLSYTGVVPLFLRICPGGGRGLKHQAFTPPVLVEKKKPVPEMEMDMDMVEGGREELLFLSRQFSGKGWKPSLDTIKEKTIKAKVTHWLL